MDRSQVVHRGVRMDRPLVVHRRGVRIDCAQGCENGSLVGCSQGV
jgi:hypothetical protein